MAPTMPSKPQSCWKPLAISDTFSPQGHWISLRRLTLIAYTTCQSIRDTVLLPTANISLQMRKIEPWFNLNNMQARRTTTGTANRYLVSFLRIVGVSKEANLNTARLVNLNISIQRRSSYSCNRNLENQVVDRGSIQNPRSSSRRKALLQMRK